MFYERIFCVAALLLFTDEIVFRAGDIFDIWAFKYAVYTNFVKLKRLCLINESTLGAEAGV